MAKEVSEAEQIPTSELKWARKLFQGQAGGTARELYGKLGKDSVMETKLLNHEKQQLK